MKMHIRVISPASSLGIVKPEIRRLAEAKIRSLGWELSFGSHVLKDNDGSMVSVDARVADIHDALTDPSVTHLMAAIGGWDSHELLPFIDWELWKNNPKPLVGYSDLTALQNAVFTSTGIESVHGPVFSTLGQSSHLQFSVNQLTACLLRAPYEVKPAAYWIDDEWFLNLSAPRPVQINGGYLPIQNGEAEGVAVGGNLSTFMILAGTEYMPNLENTVVFLEEIKETSSPVFRRLLQQLFQQPNAGKIRGLVFGRMPIGSEVTEAMIAQLVTRFVPQNIPVLANASFGHTYPVGSFPIGRKVKISASTEQSLIKVT